MPFHPKGRNDRHKIRRVFSLHLGSWNEPVNALRLDMFWKPSWTSMEFWDGIICNTVFNWGKMTLSKSKNGDKSIPYLLSPSIPYPLQYYWQLQYILVFNLDVNNDNMTTSHIQDEQMYNYKNDWDWKWEIIAKVCFWVNMKPSNHRLRRRRGSNLQIRVTIQS